MAYTKTVWVNDSVPDIDSDNLNKMEQGIYDANSKIDYVSSSGTLGKNIVGSQPNVPYYVGLKSGTVLTMSTKDGNAIGTETYLVLLDANYDYIIAFRFYNANATRTITLTNDCEYLMWYTAYAGELQVEIGSSASTFENYYGNLKQSEEKEQQQYTYIDNGYVEIKPYTNNNCYKASVPVTYEPKRLGTGLFKVKAGNKIYINPGTLQKRVFVWKDSVSNTNSVRYDDAFNSTTETVYIQNDGYAVILFAKNNTNQNIQASDFDGSIKFYENAYTTEDSINLLEEVVYGEYDFPTLANGTAPNPSNTFCVCNADYVEVEPGTQVAIIVKRKLSQSTNHYTYGYVLYDSNKAQVGKVDVSTDTNDSNVVNIGTGVKYIRFSIAEVTSGGTYVTLRINNFASEDVIFAYNYKNSLISLLNNGAGKEYRSFNDSDISSKCTEFSSKLKAIEKCESFIFITDPHLMSSANNFDAANLARFQTYMEDMKAYYSCLPLEFIMDGGDWLNDSDYKVVAMEKLGYVDAAYKNVFGENIRRPLVGNHDNNEQGFEDAENTSTGSGLLNNDQLRLAWFSKYKHNYYEFNGMNTKFLMLDTGSDKSTTMTSYRWEQIDWAGKCLENNDMEYVIVAMHIFYNTSIAQAEKTGMATNILSLVNAFNSKETVTLNGITYDFTNAMGTVSFIISGHTHEDANVIEDGIPVIFTKNAFVLGDAGATFDMCIVDFDNSKIEMIRIGSGSSRSITILT